MSDTLKVRRNRLYAIFVLSALVLVVTIWSLLLSRLGSKLTISFLDVGQGDAVLIQTEGRKQILVDGGPDSSVLEELGSKMHFWDRTLDLIVLTHPDSDHVAGLVPVLDRYRVDKVLQYSLPEHDTAVYDAWSDKIEKEKAEIIEARDGMRINLENDVWLDVYVTHEIEEDTNDNSVVLRLMQAEECLVFLTGDISSTEEKELLLAGFGVKCSILKSPHHGSSSSSSQELLDIVTPEAVVVSVGAENRYGHPGLDVLERYGTLPIYRTDERGRVDVVFQNFKFDVLTEK